jgi:hypothetical protein
MTWTGWAAGVLLGVGPVIAYTLSRTVGVPGDSGDVGNWGYWVGTVSRRRRWITESRGGQSGTRNRSGY